MKLNKISKLDLKSSFDNIYKTLSFKKLYNLSIVEVKVNSKEPEWFKSFRINYESDIKELKSDVNTLKSDMKIVKSDIVDIKSDIVNIKSDIKLMKATPTMAKELK